jgi:hypothetical protein
MDQPVPEKALSDWAELKTLLNAGGTTFTKVMAAERQHKEPTPRSHRAQDHLTHPEYPVIEVRRKERWTCGQCKHVTDGRLKNFYQCTQACGWFLCEECCEPPEEKAHLPTSITESNVFTLRTPSLYDWQEYEVCLPMRDPSKPPRVPPFRITQPSMELREKLINSLPITDPHFQEACDIIRTGRITVVNPNLSEEEDAPPVPEEEAPVPQPVFRREVGTFHIEHPEHEMFRGSSASRKNPQCSGVGCKERSYAPESHPPVPYFYCHTCDFELCRHCWNQEHLHECQAKHPLHPLHFMHKVEGGEGFICMSKTCEGWDEGHAYRYSCFDCKLAGEWVYDLCPECWERALSPAEVPEEPPVLDPTKECVICLSAVANVAMIPCGHKNYCMPCAKDLELCGICRQPVTNRLRIYE